MLRLLRSKLHSIINYKNDKSNKEESLYLVFHYHDKAIDIVKRPQSNFAFKGIKDKQELYTYPVNDNANDKVVIKEDDGIKEDDKGLNDGDAVMYSISNGAMSAKIYVKNDGTIKLISNNNPIELITGDNAKLTLKPNGDLEHTIGSGLPNVFKADKSVTFANGANITAEGDFVTKNQISLDNHQHIDPISGSTDKPLPAGAKAPPENASKIPKHTHDAGSLHAPEHEGQVTGRTGEN